MKLGEVCDIVRGSSPRPKSDSRYYGGSVPRLMVSDLTRDGKNVFALTDTLTPLGAKQSRWMSKGDVIVAVSGAPGLPAILAQDACIHDGFVGLRNLDHSRLDADFLYAYLQFVKTTSKSRAVGAIFKNLTTDQIKDIEVPDFTIAEQKRIAGILDAADALRDKRREALAQLDTLLQSTFLDMFGDPVTNPMGWQLTALENLGMLDRGISRHRPRNEPSLLNGPYPLIQTGDIAKSGGYIRKYETTYSEKGLAQSKLWPKGTLCITIAANIAKTGILTFDSCFPDSVVGFVSSTYGMVEYAQGLFWFFQTILDQQATQVAQKNINLGMLRKLEVPIPPENLRSLFAAFVQSVEQQKSRMQAHLAELDALFASLQSRAFNGEL